MDELGMILCHNGVVRERRGRQACKRMMVRTDRASRAIPEMRKRPKLVRSSPRCEGG